ncbi:MAG: Gfo/Idh/MocA family oxidoreductase [Spirochaetota bacterium]
MQTLALIGCGRISFKHIEAAIKNAERLRLVACCDPRIDRASAKAEEYRRAFPEAAVAVYSDYKDMLNKEEPEICAIATESGCHARISIDCSAAGSHVLCEKPMALSTTDADNMIAAAHAAGKSLTVCFQNRFNSPVQKAHRALEAGRFGRMLHGAVQIRWNRGAAYYSEAPWRGTWALDGGTLMNQCTHGIDLLQWMMGEDALRVQAATRRYLRPIEAEDFGAAIVEFASGAVGIIEGTADVYPTNLNESLSLFGTTGTVVIGGLAVNRIETWRFADSGSVGDTENLVLDPSEKDPPSVYGFGHSALYAELLDAIEAGRDTLVSGTGGRKALEIILAIYQSQKTGKAVDLPTCFSTSEMEGYFGG